MFTIFFYNLEYVVPIGKQGQAYNFHKCNFANFIKAKTLFTQGNEQVMVTCIMQFSQMKVNVSSYFCIQEKYELTQ